MKINDLNSPKSKTGFFQKATSRFLTAGLAAALVGAMAMPAFRAIASYDDDDDDGCPGGSIEGSAYLKAKVALLPTEAAPAGAAGKAELEAKNRNGSVRTKLEVKTYGLSEGDYLLSAVRKSDGTVVELGMISIGLWGDDYDDYGKSDDDDDHDGDRHGDDDNDGDGHDGDSDSHKDKSRHNKSGILGSETEVDLPVDLDPLDIAQIIVSDASGTPLLVGDLVDVAAGSSLSYKANVKLYGAEAAPMATGKALVSTSGKKGKVSDRFTLTASRLPANAEFKVMVNGQIAGTVKSNKKGRLMVKKLNAKNLMLSSVRLVDDQGRVAARARF